MAGAQPSGPDGMEPADIQQALSALGDINLPPAARRAALQWLILADFVSTAFDSFRAQYVQILRTVATDPDASLRAAAFGVLVHKQDLHAQNLLLQGLQNPASALVSILDALQLLAEDSHAPASTAARDALANSSDPEVRAEAAYLLASDPAAAPLLAALIANKSEHALVRQAGAASLSALDPQAFELVARAIAGDPTDYPEIRALSRTGLALGAIAGGSGAA